MNAIRLLELNQIIRETLDTQLEPSYWVIAEIAELRNNFKGHCYLELVEKEENEVVARMRATIWSYAYRNIAGWFETITGSPLSNGMKVLCHVSVSFHEVYGLSINIKDIDPNFTLGERARKRQETINKLQADGIFEMNRSLSLPLVPQRLAVISSASAAGYGDFINQLSGNRYGYQFDYQLFQAIMQGDQAPASIIQALHEIHEQDDAFDLVILIRGGGAQVDLDCFDDYNLAAHIAQFPLPVITGIGHERDQSVCDLVANTQMKTPTAVAEFLISGLQTFEEKIQDLGKLIARQTEMQLSNALYGLINFGQQIRLASKEALHQKQMALGQWHSSIKMTVRESLKEQEWKLKRLENDFVRSGKEVLRNAEKQINTLEREIHLNNPNKLMEKGYTISRVNGQLLKDQKKLKAGDVLESINHLFHIRSEIIDIHPKKENK